MISFTFKNILSLAFVILTGQIAQAQSDGNSWANTNEVGKGVLKIIYFDQAGLIEKNSAGQLQGLCIDILDQFVAFVKTKHKKELTLSYFQEEDFNRFYQLIDQKKNSLGVGNISITEERKAKYKFTPSYMSNILKLITNTAAPNITKSDELSKLNGFTAYVISSSISEKVIEKIKDKYALNLKIVRLESGLATLESVGKDPKGFSVIDFTELIKSKRKRLQVKAQAIELEKTEEVGFVMSKKSDWDSLWKEFLTNEFKSSDKFKKSFMKYLGSDFFYQVNKR